MRFITHLPATVTTDLGIEPWRGECPLQHSNRSLRSLGRAKARPLTKRYALIQKITATLKYAKEIQLKYLHIALSAIVASSTLGCASNIKNIDTSNLVLVKENHAVITKNGSNYTLDSYIMMFQQPYYITVSRNDKKTMTLPEASEIAEEYILPRGCTEPLSRRPDLDKSNGDKTQWLIGVEC